MAITGDVGAGKSTVSGILESMGWALVSADKIAAELWRTRDVMEAAVERWGEGILENGAVPHAKIAALIFTDKAEYAWATGLLYPLVKNEIRLRSEALLKEEGKPVAAEIPMLFEAGVEPWINFKMFVTAPREVRLKRCQARGWDEGEMRRRESFFMPSGERMKLSDFVVRNDGDLDALRKAIDKICAGTESQAVI